jgi:hypothetical protein
VFDPPKERKEKARPRNRRPLEGVPYDHGAFGVIYEMLDYCKGYIPDAPSEIRFLQELAQEYPRVNLVAEFRKARDYLEAHPDRRPESNLKLFLRNWVSNGVNKYGVGQPRIIGYETETIFVPAKDNVGGDGNAGTNAAQV